ncbi:MAG: serine hydrolase [Anaerolineae bacterium]|nr:beta-lactamase family protein [Thermoflexales bacterium]MDW8407907.1 serine hydrolase [Anaerolineae bacterium]
MSTSTPLPHSAPEAEGISSAAILKFVNSAEKHIDALHSFMLLRHGKVVAQGWWSPYRAECVHQLFSLSKSFTSTAIGLAVAEGRLSIDDAVLSFFPDDAPAKPSKHLQAMRVRHLLAMSTGHDHDTTGFLHRRKDGNWPAAFLARPVKFEPGTHFLYNTGATYMLSAILQKLTGQTLMEYLTPRLFEPLGITQGWWESDPRGVNVGGWGLNITTDAIARFGQLYLNKGVWNGQRILPEAWVEAASAPQAPFSVGGGPDWEQGYGYQFWRCRHNAYRGDGAFGQYCIVMPDQDAVLAITGGVKDMQAVLDLVWKTVLPAMKPEPLPADDAAHGALNDKLAHLALKPIKGRRASAIAARVSGRVYEFPKNDQRIQRVSLAFERERSTLTIREGRQEHVIVCGHGDWIEGVTGFDQYGLPPLIAAPQRKVAASGAWTADDTYTVKLCFYETPFRPTLTFHFTGKRVRYTYEANASFGPTKRPTLIGQAR